MITTDMMPGLQDPTASRTPELAIIGLGRMGGGMARPLIRSGHSLAELKQRFPRPRAGSIMVPLRNQIGGHAVERS
jgi:hypothetical protein